MSLGQNDGIAQLLEAERRAAEKIGEARKRKSNRLIDARNEAENEIERYKRSLDLELETLKKNTEVTNQEISVKIEQLTQAKIAEMDVFVQSRKKAIAKEIIAFIVDVRPHLHRNYFRK